MLKIKIRFFCLFGERRNPVVSFCSGCRSKIPSSAEIESSLTDGSLHDTAHGARVVYDKDLHPRCLPVRKNRIINLSMHRPGSRSIDRKLPMGPHFSARPPTDSPYFVLGRFSGQAGAIRHGLARALVQVDPDSKQALSNRGYLTRDSRMVERKKPGRPKARKRFQFSKR